MTITTEERLIEAIKMIQETRDYLSRLPPVPVTTDHIHKMTAFLAAPDNTLLIRQQVSRFGEYRLPVGFALVSAELRGDTLRLWQEPAPSGFTPPPVPLAEGITIELRWPENHDRKRA
ncbi:hypothetical protein [Eoetvoesiella caeni]